MRLLALFSASAAVIALVGCTAAPTTLPPGEYSKTEKSVNEYGTEVTKKSETRVYYDEEGEKRAVQETETSTDPKGLFNKSTSKTVKTYN